MKTYKRSNTGKGTTWTGPRVLMHHRVLDECVNAVLGSDKFIASDVGRICSFWSHVTEIKTYLPILDAEDIYTWDWYRLHISSMLKLNPSCGSYTEGAAGDTGIHTQLWLGLQEKAPEGVSRTPWGCWAKHNLPVLLLEFLAAHSLGGSPREKAALAWPEVCRRCKPCSMEH